MPTPKGKTFREIATQTGGEGETQQMEFETPEFSTEEIKTPSGGGEVGAGGSGFPTSPRELLDNAEEMKTERLAEKHKTAAIPRKFGKAASTEVLDLDPENKNEVEQPNKPSVPNKAYWKKVYDWTVNAPHVNQSNTLDEFIGKYSNDDAGMLKVYTSLAKGRGKHPIPWKFGGYEQFKVDAFGVEEDPIKGTPEELLMPERDGKWLTKEGQESRDGMLGFKAKPSAAPAYSLSDMALKNVRNEVDANNRDENVDQRFSEMKKGLSGEKLAEVQDKEYQAKKKAEEMHVDATTLEASKDILGGHKKNPNYKPNEELNKKDGSVSDVEYALGSTKESSAETVLKNNLKMVVKTLDAASTDVTKLNSSPFDTFMVTQYYQEREKTQRNKLEDSKRESRLDLDYWEDAASGGNWDAALELPYTKYDAEGNEITLSTAQKKEFVMKALLDAKEGYKNSSWLLENHETDGSLDPEVAPKMTAAQNDMARENATLEQWASQLSSDKYGKGTLMQNGDRDGNGAWSKDGLLDEIRTSYRTYLENPNNNSHFASRVGWKNDFKDAWEDLEKQTGRSVDYFFNRIESEERLAFNKEDRMERLFQDESYMLTKEGFHTYEEYREKVYTPQFERKLSALNEEIRVEVAKKADAASTKIMGSWQTDADATYSRLNDFYSPKYAEAISNSPEAQAINNKYQTLMKGVNDETQLAKLSQQYNDELQTIEGISDIANKHQKAIDDVNEKLEKKYSDRLFTAQKEIADWSIDYYYENTRKHVSRLFAGNILAEQDADSYVNQKIRGNAEFNSLSYGDKKKALEAEWGNYKVMMVKNLSSTAKKIPANEAERSKPWWEWTGKIPKTKEEITRDKSKIQSVTSASARREFMYPALDAVLYKGKNKEKTVYAVKSHAEEAKHDAQELLNRMRAGTVPNLDTGDLINAWKKSWGAADNTDYKYGVGGDKVDVALKHLDEIQVMEGVVNKLSDVVNHSETDQTFWEGFHDGFSGETNEYIAFVSSIIDIGYNYNAYGAAMKLQNGEPLSQMESLLLNETASTAAINQMKPTNVGNWTGNGVKHMIPIVVEFLATAGGATMATTATKELVKKGLNRGLKKGVKDKVKRGIVGKETGEAMMLDMTEDAIKTLGEKGIGKHTFKALDMLVNSVAQATLNPQMYINTTLQRMTPEVVLALSGEYDDIMVEIGSKGEDFGEAFTKAFGMTWAEMFTEQLGGTVLNGAASKALGKTNIDEYLKRTMIGGYMRSNKFVSKSAAMASIVAKGFGWHGFSTEYAEEFINGRLQALITGDKGVWDISKKEEKATFYTVAIFGGMMKGVTMSKSLGEKVITKGNNTTLAVEVKDLEGKVIPANVDIETSTWRAFNKMLGKKKFDLKALQYFLANNELTGRQQDVLGGIYAQVNGKEIQADPIYQQYKKDFEEETGDKIDDSWLGMTIEGVDFEKEAVTEEIEETDGGGKIVRAEGDGWDFEQELNEPIEETDVEETPEAVIEPTTAPAVVANETAEVEETPQEVEEEAVIEPVAEETFTMTDDLSGIDFEVTREEKQAEVDGKITIAKETLEKSKEEKARIESEHKKYNVDDQKELDNYAKDVSNAETELSKLEKERAGLEVKEAKKTKTKKTEAKKTEEVKVKKKPKNKKERTAAAQSGELVYHNFMDEVVESTPEQYEAALAELAENGTIENIENYGNFITQRQAPDPLMNGTESLLNMDKETAADTIKERSAKKADVKAETKKTTPAKKAKPTTQTPEPAKTKVARSTKERKAWDSLGKAPSTSRAASVKIQEEAKLDSTKLNNIRKRLGMKEVAKPSISSIYKGVKDGDFTLEQMQEAVDIEASRISDPVVEKAKQQAQKKATAVAKAAVKRGDALMEKGEHTKAQAEYSKAAKSDPSFEGVNDKILAAQKASGASGNIDMNKKVSKDTRKKTKTKDTPVEDVKVESEEGKAMESHIAQIDGKTIYEYSDSSKKNGKSVEANIRDLDISDVEKDILRKQNKERFEAWKKENPEYKASLKGNRRKPQRVEEGRREGVRFSATIDNIVNRLRKAFGKDIEVVTDQQLFDEAALDDGYLPDELDTVSGMYGEGVVYLNPSYANEHTALEEFGHLWAAIAKQVSPKIYNRLANLAKKGARYQALLEDPFYKDFKEDELIEEAVVKTIADRGMDVLETEANRNLITAALVTLWKGIKKALRINANVNLNTATLDSFATEVAKEMLSESPISKTISTDAMIRLENGHDSTVKVDKGILAKPNLWDKNRRFRNSWFREYKGAGKEYGQALIDSKSKVLVWTKKSELLVRDYNSKMNDYLNGEYGRLPTAALKFMSKHGYAPPAFQDLFEKRSAERQRINLLVNSYMQAPTAEQLEKILANEKSTESTKKKTKEQLLKEIPAVAIQFARRSRTLIDELQTDLEALLSKHGVMEGTLKETFTNNHGVWIHRSYQMHDVHDYKKKWDKVLTEKQISDIRNHIVDTYKEAAKIRTVSWQRARNGEITYSFTAHSGIKSQAYALDVSEVLYDAVSAEETIRVDEAIKEQLKDSGKNQGTIKLEESAKKTKLIEFDVTKNDVDAIIDDIITPESTSDTANGSKVGTGKWESGALKKRGNIEEPIRLLMGEYLDPRVNLTKSVMKASMLMEKGKVEFGMLEEGEGSLFIKPETKMQEKSLAEQGMVLITVNDSANLKGYWTTPEIADLLYNKRDGLFGAKADSSPWSKGLIAFNSLVKASLTILSPASQARNFMGAGFNLLATGNIPRLSELFAATKSASADFTNGQMAASMMSTPLGLSQLAGWTWIQTMSEGKAKDKRAQFLENYLEALEYGLIDESIEAGTVAHEANKLFHETINTNAWQELIAGTKDAYKQAIDLFSKPYQSSDAIFKIVQFNREKRDNDAVYREVKGEKAGVPFSETSAEYQAFIKAKSAQTVRAEQPTYSKSSDFMDKLSRAPVVGAFVKFQSQMWKTRGAIMLNIRDMGIEAKRLDSEGNEAAAKKLRSMRRKKLLGFVSAFVVIPAAATASALMYGISFDEDDAISEGLPSYSENALRLYTGGSIKNPSFIDMSFVDPSSQWHKMILALMRGDDLNERLTGFAKEFYEPFISKEIGFQAIIEAVMNKNQYGYQISPKSHTGMDDFYERGSHILKAVRPGFMNSADNVSKGLNNVTDNWGNKYRLWNEMSNVMFGFKQKERDMGKAYQGQMKYEHSLLNDARQDYKNKLGNKDTTPAELKESYRKNSVYAKEYFDNMIRKYNNLKTLGYSDTERIKLLENSNVSEGNKKLGVEPSNIFPAYVIDAVIEGTPLHIDPLTGKFVEAARQRSGGSFDLRGGLGGGSLNATINSGFK